MLEPVLRLVIKLLSRLLRLNLHGTLLLQLIELFKGIYKFFHLLGLGLLLLKFGVVFLLLLLRRLFLKLFAVTI